MFYIVLIAGDVQTAVSLFSKVELADKQRWLFSNDHFYRSGYFFFTGALKMLC